MSKGLLALQEIQRQVGNIHYFDFSDDLPRQTNIELRESGLFEIIEKELKALEIVKKKQVDVYRLMTCETLATYNLNYAILRKNELRKYEYDLLKEVFKC